MATHETSEIDALCDAVAQEMARTA
jgi:hypothetical protein